uniref:Endoplasmic reticulum-Golgi intermediate compartment protein 3 n=1 Tax=Mesocestoides corti TaxID=53468 RepID=A0A5K3EPN5_MESCO
MVRINPSVYFSAVLSVDSMDVSGEQHSAITKEINKTRVASDGRLIETGSYGCVHMLLLVRCEFWGGKRAELKTCKFQHLISFTVLRLQSRNYCGSCYGAATSDNVCCNTCDSVLEAYRLRGWGVPNPDMFEQCKDEKTAGSLVAIGKEGCRLAGHIDVNKVAGAFHIAPGKSYGQGHIHVHDLMAFSGEQFPLSHEIRHLSFGDTYPGQVNPLDNTNMTVDAASPMISYFIKLVPTIYSDYSATPLVTNQYSVTWQIKSTPLSGGSEGIPGVFFNYQISPLLVKLTKERKSFLYFLTNTCAIVGGVYTVAGLLDAFVYRSSCLLAKLH